MPRYFVFVAFFIYFNKHLSIMAKTIAEINEKIKQGKAVVVTADEIIDIVEQKGAAQAAQEVDVVTTGTFGPMCSSSVYLNIGHTKPKIKIGGGHCYLNDVPAYAGLAAVDVMLGCNALPDNDPRNNEHPGAFMYGGGHVIEDLVAGKDIRLVADAYGTDCYPRKKLETLLNIKDCNEAVMFNPRNAYQNYNVATNVSDKTIHTYLSSLKPRLGNATYSSAGQLSPLINDPYHKTIGVGTRIFLGGGIGYVAWHGTQHSPACERGENGVPLGGAATLAVIGDLKQMSSDWIKGVSMLGYGVTLAVGIGVPIPLLNAEMAHYCAVRDKDIMAPVIDYSHDYPERNGKVLAQVSYAELKSGSIMVNGTKVPTASLSSYVKAQKIAAELKEWIMAGDFLLTEAVTQLPDAASGYGSHPLEIRPF